MKKKRHTAERFFCRMVFLFAGTVLLGAQSSQKKKMPVFEIPESASCRKELVETWFLQDLEAVRQAEPQIVQNKTGDYFLVRCEEENGEIQIIVAPLVKQRVLAETTGSVPAEEQSGNIAVELVPEIRKAQGGDVQGGYIQKRSENGKAVELWIETWPKDSPGSWILYRDGITGKNLRIRYYFVPDSGVYAEFFPGKEKVFADFVIFGATAAGRVPVPVVFDWFYTAPFEELTRLTRYTLPWNYTRVFSCSYEDVKQMVGLIRSRLAFLHKAEWFEDNTASFGFLKWIIDGLVKPLTGAVTVYEALTAFPADRTQSENSALTGSLRTLPDENYTALNFIRNLSAAAISARTGIVYSHNTSGADVKTEAFSSYTDSDGERKNIGYAVNSGYPAELLKSLLYVLAVTEADRFFLGAVRRNVPVSVAGQIAERHVFEETAAFFPWFDSEGRFRVSIFEKAQEYTLDEFVEKCRGGFVFFVRVKASKEFYPDRFDEN